MKNKWLAILSVLSACFFERPGASILYFNFSPVDMIPRAALETRVNFSFSGYPQCARHCVRLGSTCQGFVMASDEVYPCTLLEGLTGVTSVPAKNTTKAFVNLYFEGEHYAVLNTQINWTEAVALCKNLGRSMVSYTESQEKINWMLALASDWLLIGAKKNSSDSSLFYDINTGRSLTVQWKPDNPNFPQSNIVVIQKANVSGYRVADDWFVWPKVTVLCSPRQ